jgi:MoxR-like ATPase
MNDQQATHTSQANLGDEVQRAGLTKGAGGDERAHASLSAPLGKDWKIFLGNGAQHKNLRNLPPPPPWRFARPASRLRLTPESVADSKAEARRARPFLPSNEMILAVNSALYLRRPLLIAGKPGTGKSTLISKVAYELQLGKVLRWPINSRSTVPRGVYEYDAVGRLQAGTKRIPPVEEYLTLGPLGTALMEGTWPRALLIDEIDKSDLDFANDLLNVIEEGEYEIPELRRLGQEVVEVRDYHGRKVMIRDGRIVCQHFPFIVMTSNAEREFPPPFLRRCVRLNIDAPDPMRLSMIVNSQLKQYAGEMNWSDIKGLIEDFNNQLLATQDVATDQLLNAVFLTVAMRDVRHRSFDADELATVRANLMRQLSGSDA